MKRYIQILNIGFASIIILSSCSNDQHEDDVKKDNPVEVTVGTASRASTSSIQSSGQVVSGETALISTRVMGFITDIKVKPGDKIQKGKLLVTISNGDILAKRAQAQALVSEAEAAVIDARRDYERYTELYNEQSASQKELENITLSYNSIKAKAEAARQMQNEADAVLGYTNLTAPFSGVITQKNADAGSMANPGMPILVIEKSGSFQVNTSVTESDIDQVKVGADARIIIESIRRTLTGKVSEVSPSSQMSGGQYQVKVTIQDNAQNGLHSGMYAKVSIGVSEARGEVNHTVMVSASAVFNKDQLNGLYTISEGQTALLRWVKLGKKEGEQVEVLSGLASGEKYILKAEGKLYNGTPVIIK